MSLVSAPDIHVVSRALAAERTRMIGRQVLRLGPWLAGGAAATTSAGMLLLVLLPRLLFGGSLASAGVVLAFALPAGLALGLVAGLRGLRLPTSRDAALALQARLGDGTSALATALEVSGPFAEPVARQARIELDRALASNAPGLFASGALVVAPLLAVAAILLAAVAWDVPPAQFGPGIETAPDAARQGGLASIDVASGRSAADVAAVAQAKAMQKAAVALDQAAATLRGEATSQAAAEDAISGARAAVAGLEPHLRPLEDLPQTAPADAPGRALVAAQLEGAAGALRRRADVRLAAGTGGEGSGGEVGEGQLRAFVPFPAIQSARTAEPGLADLAGQSPARRALVERALAAVGE